MKNSKIRKTEINAALNRLYTDKSLEAWKHGDIAFYGIGYDELPNGAIRFVVFDGCNSRLGYKATAMLEYKNGNFGTWQVIA